MSRGKSVAQEAGESARHGLIPRSDTGSALPEDNTRYLGYLSTGGCRFRFADVQLLQLQERPDLLDQDS